MKYSVLSLSLLIMNVFCAEEPSGTRTIVIRNNTCLAMKVREENSLSGKNTLLPKQQTPLR
jgi:hypothetical protein